jgi:predicted secreted protein
MPAITAPFHGLKTKIHASAAALTTASAAPSNLIGEVGQIGTLELTANIIEFNAYGSDYKRKLVGQKDSGTLDLTLNWVPSSTAAPQQALLKTHYDSGASLNFAIIWTDSGNNVAGATFKAFVASYSVEQPVEDVVTASVQLAIDGAVTFNVTGTL